VGRGVLVRHVHVHRVVRGSVPGEHTAVAGLEGGDLVRVAAEGDFRPVAQRARSAPRPRAFAGRLGHEREVSIP
jgi:hypothetical protein